MVNARAKSSPFVHLLSLKKVSPELFAVAYAVSLRRRGLTSVDQGLLARHRFGYSPTDRAEAGNRYPSSDQHTND
jgi:hypothetical protein